MAARNRTQHNLSVGRYVFISLLLALLAASLSASAISTSAALPASASQAGGRDWESLTPEERQAILERAMPWQVRDLYKPTNMEPASNVSPPGASQPLTECWTIIPSENPGAGNNYMIGVDMVSETDGWAVGYYTDTTQQSDATPLNHEVAARWKFGPTIGWGLFDLHPNFGNTPTRLFGVDAIAASNVWAVGILSTTVPSPHWETLIENFNGTQFTRVPSPNVGTSHNYLVSVNGSNPNNVYAVGFYDTGGAGTRTMVQRWNGSTWQVETTPNPGGLFNFLGDGEVVP